jgi:branched-chain amino acid transport system permease protein
VKDLQPTRIDLGVLIVVCALCATAPFWGSRFVIYNMTIIAIYSVVVISLNLLIGLAGQATFAQTTFMAIGGYGSAILTTREHLDPWLAMAISLALSILLAIVIGKPLLRLKGHYLSMGTVALALGTASFANASTFTNGGWGISGVPALTIGSFSFRNPVAFYVLAWTVCGASLLTFYLLANSHIGRAWRALSTRQEIAATLGIDVAHYKLVAFVIGAIMASIAGSLYVEYTRFVGPDLYDIGVMINLMIMLFVGGLRSITGPIVGAGFVILVPQLVAGFERFQSIVFYVLLLLVLLVWPSGLLGRVRDKGSLLSTVRMWLKPQRGSEQW